MKKIIYLIITFLVFSFYPFVYANDNGFSNVSKTIKEFKKDIENISKVENNLDAKFKLFLEEYKISSYIKQNLTPEENKQIKNIANNYLKNNWTLEFKLSNINKEEEILKIQNSLLDLRKDLYKNLVPFINQKYYKNYLSFVEWNIKNYVEKNNLYLNKQKLQANYNSKVDVLEKKIEENNQNLDNELRIIIDQKFDEKISNLIDTPSFSKLSNVDKIKALEKVIDSLNIKVKVFASSMNYNSIYIESDKKKLEIYKIMIQKLQWIAMNLK